MVAEPAHREEVDVSGLRTSLLVAGEPDASIVLFVHGNPGTGDSWRWLIDEVSPFARCVAPDMPGYGVTAKPADFSYTVDGYARYLGRLLDVIGARSIHLVAHDLGGAWGLAWAATAPRQLASLSLLSIGAMPGYRWHRYARLYRLPVVGELILRMANRGAVRSVLQRGSRHAPPSKFVGEVVRQYRDGGTRRAILDFYRATTDLGVVTADAAVALRDLDPPTVVVWGAGDPYVPVRFAQVQRRFFPRAEVVVLDGMGHWPFVDDPAAVARIIVPFLRTHVRASPSDAADKGHERRP